MLTTEKMRVKSQAQDTFIDSTSSSPMVLLANSGANTWRSTYSMEKVHKPWFNFNKGSCRFGSYCKFLNNGVHGSSLSGTTTSTNVTQEDMRNLQSLLAKFGCGTNYLSISNSTGLPSQNNNNPVALQTSMNPVFASVTSPSGFNTHATAQSVIPLRATGIWIQVLLRCDSTGDIYPVTKPSTIPHAFLAS
ncbi:hypothetical protein Tco_0145820 [Tanacetum coccineum]